MILVRLVDQPKTLGVFVVKPDQEEMQVRCVTSQTARQYWQVNLKRGSQHFVIPPGWLVWMLWYAVMFQNWRCLAALFRAFIPGGVSGARLEQMDVFQPYNEGIVSEAESESHRQSHRQSLAKRFEDVSFGICLSSIYIVQLYNLDLQKFELRIASNQ